MDSDFLTGIIGGVSVMIIIIIYYAWQKKTQRKKFEQFLREKKLQDKVARKAYNSTNSSEMFQANGNHGNLPIVKENTPSPTTQHPPKPASWISANKYDSPPSVPTINLARSVTPRRNEEIINQPQKPQNVQDEKILRDEKSLRDAKDPRTANANDIYSTTQKLGAIKPTEKEKFTAQITPANPSNNPSNNSKNETAITSLGKDDKANNLTPAINPIEPFHILVADDSLVVRKKLNDLLTRAGYATIMKKDGWEAFTHLNHETSQKPDLIITDIEMPQMNGFQLIENIRKHQGIQDIPIVVISSHVDMHFKLLESGSIQGFIAKPFENDLLLGQVGYLLNANS